VSSQSLDLGFPEDEDDNQPEGRVIVLLQLTAVLFYQIFYFRILFFWKLSATYYICVCVNSNAEIQEVETMKLGSSSEADMC